MKKTLTFFTLLLGALAGKAQWTNAQISVNDICVASADLQVAIEKGSNALMRYTPWDNSWLTFPEYPVVDVAIAEDGWIWYVTPTANPGNNLFYIDILNNHNSVTGHLSGIAVQDECHAVGNYYDSFENNIYESDCAGTFSLASPNIGAQKIDITPNGAMIAARNSTGFPYFSNGTGAFTQIGTLSAQDVAIGDQNMIAIVSNNVLYFKSGSSWVPVSAPTGVQKVSIASDGTVAIVTNEATNNVYYTQWENFYCETPAPPQPTSFDNLPVCVGGEYTLSVFPTQYQVEWYDSYQGGTLLGTGNSFQLNVDENFPANTTIYARATNGQCVSDSWPFNITLYNAPVITTSGNIAICPGNEVTLSASTDIGMPITWSNGSTSNAINVTPASTTTYTLSSSYGPCEATASITVTISDNPTFVVEGPTSYCSPVGGIAQSVLLTATPMSNNITWNNGWAGAQINVFPTQTTTYVASYEIAPNCIATGSITIEYLMTEVSNVQIFTCGSLSTSAEYEGNFYQIGEHFVYMGEASNGCDSYTQLTVSPFVVNIDFIDGTLVASEFENAVYYWYECGNEVSLQVGSSNTFTPTYSGLYNVYVETDICGTDNIDCVEIVVGVNELESFNFQLSPNPATSEFRLSNLPLNAAVQIFDTAGKLVFASKSISSNMTIGTEHLEPGLYIVQVQNDGGNFASEKLIISE